MKKFKQTSMGKQNQKRPIQRNSTNKQRQTNLKYFNNL